MNTKALLSGIGQIAITVSDVQSALPFYRDILGLQFLFSPSPNLAFLDAGGIRIMLSTPQGSGTPGHNSILYFKATEISKTHAAIVGRGATNERAPQLTAKMSPGPRARPNWTFSYPSGHKSRSQSVAPVAPAYLVA